MELKIIYSKKVNLQFKEIFLSYNEIVGPKVSHKFIKNLKKRVELLTSNPYLGKTFGNNNEFRFIIYSYYLIIYNVLENESIIKIILIFDTRQDPNKLIGQLKGK